MSGYAKYAKKAFAKLKEKGSPITFKRTGKKVYNPATNTYEDNGEEFSGFAIQRNFSLKSIDGKNIRFGDVLFMASLDKRPLQNDEITFMGQKFTVVNCDPMNPDGTTDIFFNIQARR